VEPSLPHHVTGGSRQRLVSLRLTRGLSVKGLFIKNDKDEQHLEAADSNTADHVEHDFDDDAIINRCHQRQR